MALYLESRVKSSSIKQIAIAILGSIIAAGVFVLGFFALTAAMLVAAVAFLVGWVWWKISGKKRFQAATRQAFSGTANADFMRAPATQEEHSGRIIEGEVVRRE